LYADQVKVYVNGTLQVGGYTLTGVGDAGGGNVIFSVAPVNGSTVLVRRISDRVRSTDFQQAPYFTQEELLDIDQDYQTMLLQEAAADATNALRIPAVETSNVTLPDAADRANKAVVFDEFGNVGVSEDDYADQAAATAASAAAALASENAAEAAAIAAGESADRVDLGALDDAVAATAADRVQTGLDADATAADRVQTGLDAASADADRIAAESARDAALLSRGVFASTADALSKGVVSLASVGAGSGGTNGTFDLAFSGGAGTGAAGRFVVAGGAVVSTVITANGRGYTSAPTVSFAASSGLTGASATAVIANNTDSGEYFSVPKASPDSTFLDLYLNSAGSATLINSYPSSANFVTGYTARSGYIYGVVDTDGKLLFGFDSAGQLISGKDGNISTILTNAVSSLVVNAANPRAGYTHVLMDTAGKVGFGVMLDGDGVLKGRRILAEIDSIRANALSAQQSRLLTATRDLVFVGDSLTAGAGGQTTWREQLPALLSGAARTSTNYAIGGQTSSQIAARMGGIYTFLTITSNTIPASGAVAVTARTISLLTSQGDQSIAGTLYGVAGTLTRAGDDSYSFTRTTAGSTVYVPPETPFVPDVLLGDAPFSTTFIFIGRNDLGTPDTIKTNIRRMVEWLRSQDKHFIVLTPTNGGPTDASTPSTEGSGSTTYNNIVSIEQWAEDAYGELALNVRKYSLQFGNGSTGDNLDVAAGVVPRSLRIDGVHFTTAFHTQIATKVAEIINRKEW
jgi:lysophospholipase L1-like esterase